MASDDPQGYVEENKSFPGEHDLTINVFAPMDHPFIFLGIDVSSESLDLWLTPTAESPHCHLDYSDKALEDWLNRHSELTPDTLLVGVESTGEYHFAVVKYFLKKGFPVKILNPILTKQYVRTTIRGLKTDKSDAEVIASLLQAGHGETACLQGILNFDKELLRTANTVTQHAAALKQLLHSFKRKGLTEDPNVAEQLQSAIKVLETLSDGFVRQATEVRTEAELWIDSIPGFATHLSAVIYHELGDISRFASVKSLVAFAGLDPMVRQSGTSINSQGRLSKRGSTHLRHALFIAANVARNYDPELRAYYQKKRAEGRPHVAVLCMISRKLLARIYAVLKQQRPYVRHV